MMKRFDVKPSADELRLAINILHRKAVQDSISAREYELRGDDVAMRAYEQRESDLLRAACVVIACLDGDLPNT